ncbi:DUF3558 family protein [Actinosynnema sp. NPDC020468]|uniref:DUF3558 family protein n=1 Tax=Actinosynnema sp. NPDC020468 TaxID=3154488 RepID=UPI0033DBC68A
MAAPLLLLGVVLAGCTTDEPGNATAGTTTAGTSAAATTTKSVPTTTASSGPSLADVKTCDIYRELASQLGLSKIEQADKDSCYADVSASESVQFDLHPDKGLADYVKNAQTEVSETTVNGRKALLAKKALTSTSCVVAIEVTAKSRVDFVGTSNDSLDKSCENAQKVAKAVEPKLPK